MDMYMYAFEHKLDIVNEDDIQKILERLNITDGTVNSTMKTLEIIDGLIQKDLKEKEN